MKIQSRRSFLKAAVRSGVGLALLPDIIPARLLGADAPGKKINVAQIGCGRMGRSDLGNVMTEPLARVVAVCDLDAKRLTAGQKMAEDFYTRRGESGVKVKTPSEFRSAWMADCSIGFGVGGEASGQSCGGAVMSLSLSDEGVCV